MGIEPAMNPIPRTLRSWAAFIVFGIEAAIFLDYSRTDVNLLYWSLENLLRFGTFINCPLPRTGDAMQFLSFAMGSVHGMNGAPEILYVMW